MYLQPVSSHFLFSSNEYRITNFKSDTNELTTEIQQQ